MDADLNLGDVFQTILGFRDSLEGLVSNISSDIERRSTDYVDQINFIALAARMAPISKAQLLQDLWVLYELKQKRAGYFVEFGACDGLTFSNTFLLENLFGWQGALAEPARVWHDKLRANRHCFITDRCVYKEDGRKVAFNEVSAPELSTLDALSSLDYHAQARQNGTRYEVETISLKSFLVAANAPKTIDYMSIDTEGSEADILESFNFSEYDISLVSVEHNYTSQRNKIYEIMTKNGYRRKFEAFSAFDDWYIKI